MRTASYALIVTLQAVLVFSGTGYLADHVFSGPGSERKITSGFSGFGGNQEGQGDQGDQVNDQLSGFTDKFDTLHSGR